MRPVEHESLAPERIVQPQTPLDGLVNLRRDGAPRRRLETSTGGVPRWRPKAFNRQRQEAECSIEAPRARCSI